MSRLPDEPRDAPPTRIRGRLIAAHCAMLENPEPKKVAYMHTVFCQASLPLRNPGDDVRTWDQQQGRAQLRLMAGGAIQADSSEFAPVGLPYGPAARLVFIHLMTQAVLQQSPHVELESSLRAFAQTLGLHGSGRELRTLREQLLRIAGCSFRIRTPSQDSTKLVQGFFIEQAEMLKPPGSREPWPRSVCLGHKFYEDLREHAVPLDYRAVDALKHNAQALDCYAWLARRLARVSRRTFIPWKALYEQSGGRTPLRKWRQRFAADQGTLAQVLDVYLAAKEAVEVTDDGLFVNYAPPPVPLVEQSR